MEINKTCDNCRHNPSEKKWPCVDCIMQNGYDRWEEPVEMTNDRAIEICKDEIRKHHDFITTGGFHNSIPSKYNTVDFGEFLEYTLHILESLKEEICQK